MRQISIFRRKKKQHETLLLQQETPIFNLPDFEQLAKKYDAVIHIGTPGTGSAAIQKFLADNHTKLAEIGFYCPAPLQNNTNISHEHSKLGEYLKKNDLDSAKSAFENYLEEAKQNNLTLLLSEKSLYEYPDKLKEVTLEKNCKIIAFFREPFDALYSNYNQAIKEDFVTTTLEKFCLEIVSPDNDRLTGKVFEKWHAFYGQQNVLVLGYDPIVFEKIRLEMLFLAALGVNENLFHAFQYTEEKINTRFNFPALELRRWLNFVIDKELFYYNHKLDWFLQTYSENFNDTPNFFIQEHIPQELYVSLKEMFTETNSYLLKEILTLINPDFLVNNDTLNDASSITRYKCDNSELKNILEIIIEKDELIKKYLINRTTKTLSSNSSSYYVLRLAELLEIDIQPYLDFAPDVATKEVKKPLFTQAQINIFLSEKTRQVHLLHQIAIAMERHGDYESALLVIERALTMPVKPPGIKLLYNRIKSNL